MNDAHWKALYRIAFPEISGVDSLAANPALWPCTVAYEALGGPEMVQYILGSDD